MHGPAFSSVTGTTCPSGRNNCVIPIFLPRIPGLMSTSLVGQASRPVHLDRKSTRLNSSHLVISYAVFCLKKNKQCDSGGVWAAVEARVGRGRSDRQRCLADRMRVLPAAARVQATESNPRVSFFF